MNALFNDDIVFLSYVLFAIYSMRHYHISFGNVNYYCLQSFWREVIQIIPNVCYIKEDQIELNIKNLLFNRVHESRGNIAYFIILVAKYSLYRSRCKMEKPNSKNLFSELLYIKNIEKYNAISTGCID